MASKRRSVPSGNMPGEPPAKTRNSGTVESSTSQVKMEPSNSLREEGPFSLFDIMDQFNSLRKSLSHVSASSDSLKSSCEAKLTEISDRVTEQKKKSNKNSEEIPIEKVGKALQASLNGMKKCKTGGELEYALGFFEVVSSMQEFMAGTPDGPPLKALCVVISAILAYNKPEQASVVDRLANIVHMELFNFNKKLQDQKYDGLRHRVSDQMAQLQAMKPGHKLDDPKLWNDFIQFLGELSNRFEAALPFQYDKGSLTKDPDVADFVTAVVTYCEAYVCFMALLMAAKGKFADLGWKYKGDVEAVDRKIRGQQNDARKKLTFLSDKQYLKFLGRLPCEGGKLIKIVALSRNLSGKRLVETLRSSLGLPQMPDLATVESAAAKVAGQSVKLRLEGHVLSKNLFGRVVRRIGMSPFMWIQFINETDFPMKIVSRKKSGWGSLDFVQNVQPHSSYPLGIPELPFTSLSSCGYIIIFLNGEVSCDIEPRAEDSRAIEFALSRGYLPQFNKINIQDNTCNEFTHGEDAYKVMKSGEGTTLYWFDRRVHFMARAEIVSSPVFTWRFVIQDFDPLALED